MPLLKEFKPVTHVADVAKKRLSIYGPKLLSFLAKGMQRRMEPMIIINTKDKITSKYGFNCFFFITIDIPLYKENSKHFYLLYFSNRWAKFDYS